MQQENGRVFSYVYGVEEFVYLLGNPLKNFGGVIGSGIIHSFSPSNGPKFEKERSFAAPYHEKNINTPTSSYSNNPQETNMTASQEEPSTEQSSGPEQELQIPGEFSNPDRNWKDSGTVNKRSINNRIAPPTRNNEVDEQELQLRDSIRNMRVNFEEEGPALDLAEVAGLESVKMALEEFATFFLHFPHLTRNLRQRSTTGILLFGPQGTGKTLLLKSFAQKYNLSLYDIRASAIMSKYVGESEKFIRALFKEVRSNTPAILMLDECDGLLCNPTADASQSHSYRLLQNELKNQWSDLIYSRDEVIVIGATNKPHDIDMDGFGRRLSLKLHVELPSEAACQMILKSALDRLRHQLKNEDFVVLGSLCHERGLSGYDIDCLVEGQLRRALRGITVAKYFVRIPWDDGTIVIPCEETDAGAEEGPWSKVATNPEEVSYRPFDSAVIKAAILRARSTVDEHMIQKHVEFASVFGTDD